MYWLPNLSKFKEHSETTAQRQLRTTDLHNLIYLNKGETKQCKESNMWEICILAVSFIRNWFYD